MKVEVGKKYKGKINGAEFTIVKEYIDINGYKHLVLKLDDGRELHHSKSFVEHLLIKEVK